MLKRRDIGTCLDSLTSGQSIALLGLDRANLAAALAGDEAAPHVLQLELAGNASTMIGKVIDDLADLAGALWPKWNEPVASEVPGPLLSRWCRAAARFAEAGRRPRFAWLARELEIAHLLSVLPNLVLVAETDPLHHERAASVVATLEWCCRHGARAAALLAEPPAPEPPWDRLLSSAVTVEPPLPQSARQRLITPIASATTGGSPTESRMREALRGAPDLASLFEDQITLHLGPLGPTPRVDFVWRDGKIVVELDGPEHARDAAYAADRHRDYELMVAGYLVLRLTNVEVNLDLARSLDKIRRVVDLRRS